MEILDTLSIKDIDYFTLIGLTKETNRPPGGIRSIINVAQNSFLNANSLVLEIGTSTGFTAIELARLTGCKVHAIDINENSLREAETRAKATHVNHLIHFEKQDATNLNFPDSYFDLVFCGNVTSYINDKFKALNEYARVLKPNGFLAGIPMYYLTIPSPELLTQVSNAVGSEIKVTSKQDWLLFFNTDTLRITQVYDFKFNTIDKQDVDHFVDSIFQKPHMLNISKDTKKAIEERYRYFLQIFRSNLIHVGFSIILLRKENHAVEPELFSSIDI